VCLSILETIVFWVRGHSAGELVSLDCLLPVAVPSELLWRWTGRQYTVPAQGVPWGSRQWMDWKLTCLKRGINAAGGDRNAAAIGVVQTTWEARLVGRFVSRHRNDS
jgi:hypothetical protein